MFLKILFYFLAAWWVLLALRPLFRLSAPPPKPVVRKRPKDEEGEYVDYEEVE